ncbi:MAG: HAD family hydrolase [Kiritimatiellia bacterium]|nr:HAD family hydrolase [Kiritimatiellia bacterium]
MTPIRHLVWDWNGTLLDDIEASVYALNRMCRDRSLPPIPDIETYRSHFGFPVRDYYRSLGFRFDDAQYDRMSEEFHRHFFASGLIRLRPQAKEILDTLATRLQSQSILSAAEHTMLHQMTLKAGIHPRLRHIIGAGDLHGTSKLQQARHLARLLSAPPEHILLVGDTLHDAEVAQTCGWNCILLTCGHQTAQRLQTAHCPLVDTLHAIPEHPLLAPTHA